MGIKCNYSQSIKIENEEYKMSPLEAIQDLREVPGLNDYERNKRLDIIEEALKIPDVIKEIFDFLFEKIGGRFFLTIQRKSENYALAMITIEIKDEQEYEKLKRCFE